MGERFFGVNTFTFNDTPTIVISDLLINYLNPGLKSMPMTAVQEIHTCHSRYQHI